MIRLERRLRAEETWQKAAFAAADTRIDLNVLPYEQVVRNVQHVATRECDHANFSRGEVLHDQLYFDRVQIEYRSR